MGVYYLALPLGTALGLSSLGGFVGEDWGWPGRLLGRRSARPARRRGRAPDHTTRAAVPPKGRRTPARPTGPAQRLPGSVQDADLRVQHRGHGRRDLRHGSLCRLGLDLLSDGPRHVDEGGRRLDRRPARGRRAGRHRAGHVPGRLSSSSSPGVPICSWPPLSSCAAIPLGLFGILDPERVSSLGFLFGAMVLLAMVLGPCNTVIANVVPANRRAAGYALSSS